jgi:hypothetical protein
MSTKFRGAKVAALCLRSGFTLRQVCLATSGIGVMNCLNRYRSKRTHSNQYTNVGWHCRVVAIDILHSLTELNKQAQPVIIELDRQEDLLLGSARIYLQGYSLEDIDTAGSTRL